MHKVDPLGKQFDRRYQKVSIEQQNETLMLKGNTNEVEGISDKDVKLFGIKEYFSNMPRFRNNVLE